MIWYLLRLLVRILVVLFVLFVCGLIWLIYDPKVFQGWALEEVKDILEHGLVP